MNTLTRSFAALALVAATVLAGCSSSSSGTATPPTSDGAPSSVASSSSPSTSSPSTSSSVIVATPDPTATSASSASGGGDQPPTGSASVHFGDTSLVALTDFTTEKTNPIKLTISMTPGKLSDLAGFDLDAQTKKGTPFYVSYALTNVSTKTIDSSGFGGLLSVFNAAGEEASSLTLLGSFDKCEGAAPDKLAPQASGKGCDVYVLPAGQQVTKVEIDNGSNGTITWS